MSELNHLERNTSEEPDWARLVESIQCRLYLSQLDIAKHCGVARQTVSAWTNCRRNPGLRARRALMELAARAEAVASVSVPEESVPLESRRLRDAHDLGVLVGQLSGRALEQLLDFARFLAERQKT
jgi:transcriptional regulator with XRE-family HTH domain